MGTQQHISKSTQAVSTASSAKLLQTRPFQNEHESENQQPSQLQTAESTASSFDLTTKTFSAPEPATASPAVPTLGLPLQAKLTIGEPNDKYEQEADRVAQDVVQRINAPDTPSSPENTNNRSTNSSLRHQPSQHQAQRQVAPKTAVSGFDLTTKTFAIAPQPTAAPKPLLQPKLVPSESALQREVQEEDELQMKPLQRQTVAGGEASNELESTINRARSGGQSLDTKLQQSMGQAMGADFSGVKVHTDSTADTLNKSIQAKAFTTGQDLFFRQGTYQPTSRAGQELIAHELTHVVQQNGSAVQRSSDSLIQRTDYEGPTLGIEREIQQNYKIRLEGEDASGGTLGKVTKDNKVVAEYTTDMKTAQTETINNQVVKWTQFTIELKTTPVEFSDADGITVRQTAIQKLVQFVQGVAGGEVETGEIDLQDGYKMNLSMRHKVLQLNADQNVGFANQATVGVTLSDLVNPPDADENGVISPAAMVLMEARWAQNRQPFRSAFSGKYPNMSASAAELCGLIGSLMQFWCEKIIVQRKAVENFGASLLIARLKHKARLGDEEAKKQLTHIQQKQQEEQPYEEGYLGNLVDPMVKNLWGSLPKTPPLKWLEAVTSDEKKAALQILRENKPDTVENQLMWKSVYAAIVRGDSIAGHPVPDFTIQGEKGMAFELRSPPSDWLINIGII